MASTMTTYTVLPTDTTWTIIGNKKGGSPGRGEQIASFNSLNPLAPPPVGQTIYINGFPYAYKTWQEQMVAEMSQEEKDALAAKQAYDALVAKNLAESQAFQAQVAAKYEAEQAAKALLEEQKRQAAQQALALQQSNVAQEVLKAPEATVIMPDAQKEIIETSVFQAQTLTQPVVTITKRSSWVHPMLKYLPKYQRKVKSV